MDIAEMLMIEEFLRIHAEQGPDAAIAWARQQEAKLGSPLKLVEPSE